MLDYSISLVHTPLSPRNVTCKSTIALTMAKYGSFTEFTREISSTCVVDTNPRGIKATCIVSGDSGQPCINRNMNNENFRGGCVYMFMSTINEGANRKLTTSMSIKCLL